MRKVLLSAGLLILVAAVEARAEKVPPCQVHVVLFVPKGVQSPVGYQPRIDEIVGYAESFFQAEFKRWDIEKFVTPFRRSADGHVEVTIQRGKEPTSAYKPVSVRAEVMDALRRQKKLDGGRQVWWIMVYAGDPPAKFKGYLGGFGPEIGGWSVCNFDTTPGRIDPAAPLGSDFLESLTLKGMLHELGHGFQLPHIGPLKGDNAGNTLMGPTHANFRRVAPASEERVYLSQAEAALLSNHPAFRGEADKPKPLPKVEVQNLKHTMNGQTNSFVVSGRVLGSERPSLCAGRRRIRCPTGRILDEDLCRQSFRQGGFRGDHFRASSIQRHAQNLVRLSRWRPNRRRQGSRPRKRHFPTLHL